MRDGIILRIFFRLVKVFVDLVSEDELFSDALQAKEVAGGAIYEVATIQVTVGGEEVDIGRGSEFGGADAEEDVDDQKELTLNIIKNHNLKKQEGLTKKDVKSLFKNYCKKLKEKLEELIEKAADDDYETKLAKARFASFKEHFPKIKEWFDTDVIGNFDDYDL